jgi:hypothetical protein
MAVPNLSPVPGGVELSLVVQPRASRSRVVGEHDGRLKVQIAAPPVEGEANAELVELLSDLLGVPKRQVELLSGETGRRKRVRVTGVDVTAAEAALKR